MITMAKLTIRNIDVAVKERLPVRLRRCWELVISTPHNPRRHPAGSAAGFGIQTLNPFCFGANAGRWPATEPSLFQGQCRTNLQGRERGRDAVSIPSVSGPMPDRSSGFRLPAQPPTNALVKHRPFGSSCIGARLGTPTRDVELYQILQNAATLSATRRNAGSPRSTPIGITSRPSPVICTFSRSG